MLAGIHVWSWQAAYAGILDDDFLAALPVDRKFERWQRTLTDPGRGSVTWLVELDGWAVGFAATAASRDKDLDPAQWQELMSLYLLPEAWGTGAAHALTSECLVDNRPFFLWVLSDNHRAQAFYRKLGFGPDGTERPITIGERTVAERRLRRPAIA